MERVKLVEVRGEVRMKYRNVQSERQPAVVSVRCVLYITACGTFTHDRT